MTNNIEFEKINSEIRDLNTKIVELNSKIEYIDSFMAMGQLRQMHTLICESKEVRFNRIRSIFLWSITTIIVSSGTNLLSDFFPMALGLGFNLIELRCDVEEAKTLKIKERNRLIKKLDTTLSQIYNLERQKEFELTKNNIEDNSKIHSSSKVKPRGEMLEEQTDIYQESDNKEFVKRRKK